MTTLPAILPYGVVGIYGIGTSVGLTSMIPEPQDSGFFAKFGTVYQIAPYGVLFSYVGVSVMFMEKDVFCRLAIPEGRFTLVEDAKLVCKEDPVDIP